MHLLIHYQFHLSLTVRVRVRLDISLIPYIASTADALPARIVNATREPHLPLFYLGLRLPNDAAWPTGTGGPMPWSKFDIMNYDGTFSAPFFVQFPPSLPPI